MTPVMLVDSSGYLPEWVLEVFNHNKGNGGQWLYFKPTARAQVTFDLTALATKAPAVSAKVGVFVKGSVYNNSSELGHDFGDVSIYKKNTTDFMTFTYFKGGEAKCNVKEKSCKVGPASSLTLSILSLRDSVAIEFYDYVELELGFHTRIGYIDFTNPVNITPIKVDVIFRVQPQWEEIWDDVRKALGL